MAKIFLRNLENLGTLAVKNTRKTLLYKERKGKEEGDKENNTPFASETGMYNQPSKDASISDATETHDATTPMPREQDIPITTPVPASYNAVSSVSDDLGIDLGMREFEH
ncbi:hypothetical protein H0H87_008023, partial [Tephrocybe sp. NHM501043]